MSFLTALSSYVISVLKSLTELCTTAVALPSAKVKNVAPTPDTAKSCKILQAPLRQVSQFKLGP